MRGATAGLTGLLIACTGAVCAPIQVTPRPADPVLVDARGAPDANGFAALVAETERARGLHFVRFPTLELAAADDDRAAGWLAAEREALPCAPPAEPSAAPAPGSCFPAAGKAGIVCIAPPELESARRALRGLLDAQAYPRLVRAAATLGGDAGLALRSLLAGSAAGSSADPTSVAREESADLLDLDPIAVERQEASPTACIGLGQHFLSALPDPEAAFRRPPLATKLLLSPRRYRAGEHPRRLTGAAPHVDGCSVESDESIGVARLLLTVLGLGNPVSGPMLASWQGDRAVRFTCEDGERAPWVYAAELADEAHAAAFAAALPGLLPRELRGPTEIRVAGARVAAAHGLGAAAAQRWAAGLASEPMIELPSE